MLQIRCPTISDLPIQETPLFLCDLLDLAITCQMQTEDVIKRVERGARCRHLLTASYLQKPVDLGSFAIAVRERGQEAMAYR
jgi:hypothetical protein